MSETYYSAKELAQQLEMPDSSFRSMTDRLDREGIIHRTKKGNAWKYTEEAREVLEMVRSLRTQDNGYDTIVRRLAHDERSNSTSQAQVMSDELEISASQSQVYHQPAFDERALSARLLNGVEDVVSRQLTHNNELAEKYARASFEIGQLQERVSHLEEQLRQSEAKLALNAKQTDVERELGFRLAQDIQDEKPISAWEAFVSFITGRP